MDGSPDSLPEGWTVELKSRQSGAKSGIKYKCYVAPTGRKFYSKRQVSDYLKIQNLSNQARLNRKSVEMPSTSQAIVEWKEDTDEGLPPGWTKTLKCKKTGNKIRKDPYYTDPVSGYIFRSRKDVFRYLETGELGRLAIKPKNGGVSDLVADAKSSPPTEAKRQKVEGGTTQRSLFSGQSLNSGETTTDEKMLEPSATKEIIPVLEHASVESVESAGLSILASPESDDSKKIPGRELSLSATLETSPPAPVASLEKQKQQLQEGEKKSGNKKTELKSSKNKVRKELSVPRRASKRLAGVKAEPMSDLEIGSLKGQEGAVLEANPIKVEKPSDSNHQVPEQVDQLGSSLEPNHQVPEQVIQLGSALEPKSTVTAHESSEAPSESENLLHEGENNLLIKEQAIKSEAATGNLGTVEKASEKPATGDFGTMEKASDKPATGDFGTTEKSSEKPATGDLGTTGKASEKPESHLIPPFGDSWPDPCLEFAFKTLTGDNLVIEDYFQQQLGSVQPQNPSDLALPDGSGIDGFCQATDLFQFDALERPPPPPQLQKNTVLPAPSNARMISFGGDDVLQQQPSQNGTNSRNR